MARTLTKNSDGELVWTEKAFDVDEDDLSHPLTTKVELDAIDGVTQSGADRTPSWLSATVIEDGVQSGQWEERVKTTITDPGQLSEGTDYTFLYRAADGVAQTDLTRTLSVGTLPIDGTKLYEINSRTDKIHEYDLSTAWDISTASTSQSMGTEDSNSTGFVFKTDGKKLYEIGNGADKIYEHDLSTAWDVSTATLNQSTNAEDGRPQDLAFKPDGKKLYQFGGYSDKIYEHDLSTAWDISTATLNQSVNTVDEATLGFTFKPDGKKLYEISSASNKIYERDLSTAWDISTATLNQSIKTVDNEPQGLVFGKK